MRAILLIIFLIIPVSSFAQDFSQTETHKLLEDTETKRKTFFPIMAVVTSEYRESSSNGHIVYRWLKEKLKNGADARYRVLQGSTSYFVGRTLQKSSDEKTKEMGRKLIQDGLFKYATGLLQLSYNRAYCADEDVTQYIGNITGLYPFTHGKDILGTIRSFEPKMKQEFFDIIVEDAEKTLIPKLNWACQNIPAELEKIKKEDMVCGTLNISYEADPNKKNVEEQCEPREDLEVEFTAPENWEKKKDASRNWMKEQIGL